MNDTVAVGRFGSPFGVRGWIKVISFTDPIEQILTYSPWYIYKDNSWLVLDKVKGKAHGNHLVVHLNGSHDRDIAKTYTNLEIVIERQQLPALPPEEYYWVDLIGLAVVNLQGILFGKVDHLFGTGSNDVLVVEDANQKERYIPYTHQVIIDVDLPNKKIVVDWDPDF